MVVTFHFSFSILLHLFLFPSLSFNESISFNNDDTFTLRALFFQAKSCHVFMSLI